MRNAWTWIDVPGTSCGDGSRTGIGVNPGDGPGLIVFLNGGGACFDHVSCFVAQIAGTGSFGRARTSSRSPPQGFQARSSTAATPRTRIAR